MLWLTLIRDPFLHEFRLLAIGLIFGRDLCCPKAIAGTKVDGVALVAATVVLLVVL